MRVSIVIPVYNEEDFIGPCLDAIFDQTTAVDEVIVVNNNSTDSTHECLGKYDGRVVVLEESRQGICHARNAGMDAATGDVIGRIDADTRLPPWWVERLHVVFADSRVQAATGPARYYDIWLARVVAKLDLGMRKAWAWSNRQRLDWIFGANMAIRASAWRSVRSSLCQDPEIHEDLDLGIHLYSAGQWIIFSPTLVASTSSRRIRDSLPDFRRYLMMTENGYSTHSELVDGRAYRRAWLTTRIILALYFPLRFLHYAHQSSRRSPPRRLHARAKTREEPMSHNLPNGSSGRAE